MWYARFYHSNIKTHLGILRYVMVTPQSHRIHHSRLRAHRDKNFGAIFSLWDHLFGTQYRRYDEYPETGLDNPEFPHESELSWRKMTGMLWRQLAYPFERAFKSLAGILARRQAASP
jgi:sterol desaturase/sphingolipid hydroxylase (fatty acid hydroxylase superfamily)